jgi:enhancing lycopene biosynthesis protein 2
MSKRIAVILAGCGHLDGSEIRESVLTLLELDRNEVHYEIFAPDRNQHHVINHLTNKEAKATRNILTESARLARGQIQALSELKLANFDALIIPGGFGVAKNLADIAFKGKAGTVSDDFKELIIKFYLAKKPIGAICISPALVANILRDKNISVTLGMENELLAAFGANEIVCEKPDMVAVDLKNKIVSTPAYMLEGKLHKIQEGIASLVLKVLELC